MGWSPESVKALRVQRGETQGQFAAVLGVDRTTVSRWENGDVDVSAVGMAALDRISAVPASPSDDYLRGVADAARAVREALAALEQQAAKAGAVILSAVSAAPVDPEAEAESARRETNPAPAHTPLRLHKSNDATG